MATLFENALAWLPSALATAKGLTVTLASGSDEQEDVPAVRCWHRDRLQDEYGLSTDFTPYDYLIKVADFQIDDEPVEPEPGMRITEPLGVFEIVPIAGEPCFSIREDGQYRIHTARVSAAP